MMNEAETRAEHIDPALKAAGWGVVEGSYSRKWLDSHFFLMSIESTYSENASIKCKNIDTYRTT